MSTLPPDNNSLSANRSSMFPTVEALQSQIDALQKTVFGKDRQISALSGVNDTLRDEILRGITAAQRLSELLHRAHTALSQIPAHKSLCEMIAAELGSDI